MDSPEGRSSEAASGSQGLMKVKDWEALEGVCKRRGFLFSPEYFSEYGLRIGDCFGFLFRTSTGVGYLDNFISGKDISDEVKVRDFSRILRGFRLLARFLGIKVLMGHTPHHNLKVACGKSGYDVIENNSSYIRLEIR